jgi:hypothetical protein
MISRWETGDKVPTIAQVAQILNALEVTGDRYDDIIALAERPFDPQWLATGLPGQQQQLTTLLEYESMATRITAVHPLLIHGMLQTADYVRAVMRGAKVPAIELEQRVAVRLGRRDALTRTRPAQLTAIIGEAALRGRIGGPEIMLDQLRHLLIMNKLLTVDVFVLPIATDWHPALEGPFSMIDCIDGSNIVHIENRRSGIFLHEDDDVEIYREAMPAILAEAMTLEESIERIEFEIAELERFG